MTALAKSVVNSDGGLGPLPISTDELDTGFNARRLRSNLLRNVVALQALARMGIDRATVELLGLGIKEPYVTAAGVEVSGVLTYPLEIERGRRRYGYLNLDAVTVNPQHPIAWNPGGARSMIYGEHGVLVVVASPMTALRLRAALVSLRLRVAVVASSQPDRIPPAWRDAGYWATWDRIVIDDGLPASIKAAVANAASRPVELATGVLIENVPGQGAVADLVDWFDGMLSEARPFATGETVFERLDDGAGDFPAIPLSLHGGVSKGLMYYPFVIERRRKSEGGSLLCSYETLVVRTDGTLLEARLLPAPAGTPKSGRVHCLSDGTRIAGAPEPSMHATWTFASIQSFVAERVAGRDPLVRDPTEVIADVHSYLSSRVSLPNPDDFWVATAFVVLSHVYRVFPAIPLLLIEGPRGSGKSELASAISALGFNAVMMGQGSAASLVRVAQEGGGLIVLDDVEGLSAGGAGFGELSQCLKVGYRASTARKPVTLGGGRVETFDFYGPRVLTCTRGIEPILRSRCVSIPTLALGPPDRRTFVDPQVLRDELHVLGMSRAAEVIEDFGGDAQNIDGRADEVWMPLAAVAAKLCPAEAVLAIRRARMRHVD